jgi:translocation and assembly module TamA
MSCCVCGLLAWPANAQTAQPPIVSEPIVTDEEFDQSIPPLTDDIDAPMESVADWQKQQAEREKATKETRNAGVEMIPALQDGDAVETLADAPVTDPEIDNPLPPVQGFDVEPLSEDLASDDDDDDAARIRYDYRIEGLDKIVKDTGLDDELAANQSTIRARFNELSVLEDGDGVAGNGAIISAKLREDQQLLIDILTAHGFFDATVESRIDLPDLAATTKLTAVLVSSPGPRYMLGEIQFTAGSVEPTNLITRNFVPKSGEPIIADRILAAEANIALALPQQGYPFAEVGDRDILLDAGTLRGDYTLPVATGNRSSFGDIETTGKAAFGADHIEVLRRFKKGELYDSRKLDDLREALVATGLFSSIAVEPKITGQFAPDGTEYANLLVTQEAGPARTIAASAGYSTGQGLRAETSWSHRNLFPPEGQLSVAGILGTREQGASVTFRRANAGQRDRSVELSLSALHSDFAAYEAFTSRLAGRISYESTPIWQKRFTYSFGFELLGTNEEDFNFVKGVRDRNTFAVAALPAQVGFDTSDDLLDPKSGFRLNLKLSPEASLGSGKQIYARTMIEGTGYFGFGESFVLAGRARIGAIGGIDRSDLAPSRRYYGGGGGSVRGFGFQELGPKDVNNDPIGGRSIIEAAIEGRYRFGDFGAVAFVDAGQVYESSIPKFDSPRFGVGIGARYYTNFGPLRFDIATPIGRKPGESLVSVYVSIGQAF